MLLAPQAGWRSHSTQQNSRSRVFSGQSMVWLAGCGLTVALLLGVGLFSLILVQGWEALWTESGWNLSRMGQGLLPAILGTTLLTLLMSFAVGPLGVLAALYLHEVARPGWRTSLFQILVRNLAGVPSLVYGVFGLGFFCHFLGVSLDALFFPGTTPTFGSGGILWASLTLALLTLPVVVIACQEAFSRVPASVREASYACGATRWQTLHRVVLPQAWSGVLTSLVLAMARAAGEVAPLLFLGVVGQAAQLPVDGEFPYLHLERGFQHLGYLIFQEGLSSSGGSQARSLAFSALLLLMIGMLALHLLVLWLRSRQRIHRGESFF